MSEKGYRGGLVSRIKNKYSSKKYLISTAQEIGKEYWSTSILPTVLFGLIPLVNKCIYTVIWNKKEDALNAHNKIKEIVSNIPENDWLADFPNPNPDEGLSAEVISILNKNN